MSQEDLEERVEKLEEVVDTLTQQLEALVATVDDINKNQMSNLYRRLIDEERLEEMRDKYPEMVNDLEETAQNFIGPKIEEVEDRDTEELLDRFQQSAEDVLEGRTSDVETIKSTISLQYSTAQDLLTDERKKILETLSQEDFDSISELSEELGRDKMQVSKDIKALYQNAVIDLEGTDETEEDGRSLKPVFDFNRIQIKPLTFNEEVEDE